MSFLLSFLTVEFCIPLEVKEIGENIIILKVLLHMYTKCIHGREENTSCEIINSTVHVDRVCYWFWFSELFWYDCFDTLMHIFEDVDVKPSSRHEFIKAWFDRILTVNGVYIYTSRESYGQLISGQAFRVHIHLNAWTTHLMICLKNVNKSYN